MARPLLEHPVLTRTLSLLAAAFPFHKRPWLAFFRLAGISTALLLVSLAYAVIAINELEPKITVDYLKPINAEVEAIPLEDRAWPEYRKIAGENNVLIPFSFLPVPNNW